MKILVTGANGRVGSRLVPRLLEKGFSLRAHVRRESEKSSLPKGVEVAYGDITDTAAMTAALKGVDGVVHLAAFFRTLDKKDEPLVRQITGEAAISLAQLAYEQGVGRFVFVSTGMVYGATSQRPAREDDPRDAASLAVYPASKVLAEDGIMRLTATTGFDARIVRLGFLYGDRDPHLSEVLPLFQAFKRHPASRMHLVHHLDAAQAIALLLKTDGLAGRAYNVADDAPISRYEIAALTRTNDAFDPATANGPLENPWEGIMDMTALKSDTGFRPLIPSYYAANELGVL